MKPTPQCPHARHPVAFAIQVPAQTADPQHRLADRQFRWLHPFPKATPSTSTSSSLRTSSAGASGVSREIAQQHDPRRHRHIDPHGLLQSVPGLQAKILHLTAALEHQVDLLDRPPTGVFPHHLQRLVRRRGRLERPEQPVCRPARRWRRVPIPPPGSRSSARRADISGDPAPTSLASTALPPPHAAQGRQPFDSPQPRPGTGPAGSAPPRAPWPAGRRSCGGLPPRQVPAEFLPLCFFRSPVVCAIHGMKHASRIDARIAPTLMTGNFSKAVLTTMNVFHCDHCGQLVFFENTVCVNCGNTLAYLPDLGSLNPVGAGLWRSPCPGRKDVSIASVTTTRSTTSVIGSSATTTRTRSAGRVA